MAMNFNEALNKKVDDIERPKMPPNGHYIWQVTGVPKTDTITTPNGSWDTVNIPCMAVAAGEDVDQDELQAFGNVRSIKNRLSFMFDKNDENNFDGTLFRLQTFLREHIKVTTEGDGMSTKEALSACVNQQFMGELKITPDKNNPEIPRANIGTTAPVE